MEENPKINELCEVFSTGMRMPSKYYALGDRIEKKARCCLLNRLT